jgi:trehalose 6-phosphate phosphatase
VSAPPHAPTPALAAPLAGDALEPLASASPLLLLFDIDGTLAPIASRPQDAVVPDAARRSLSRLAALPGVRVGLVTGRSADDGARLVSVPGLWVIGNHGVETVDPDGTRHVDPAALAFAEPLARAADALAPLVAATPGTMLEDKRWSLSLHYRLAPAAEPRLRRAAEHVAKTEGLRLGEGSAVLEVRIPAEVDKGTAVVTLARRMGAAAPGSAVLFAGDDRTDEDAFRRLAQLPGAVTVRVGAPEVATHARWRVDAPADVHALLESLLTLRAVRAG